MNSSVQDQRQSELSRIGDGRQSDAKCPPTTPKWASWEFQDGTWTLSGGACVVFGLGYTAQTVSHEQILATIHPDDCPRFAATFEHVLATGEDLLHEHRVLRGTQVGWIFVAGKVYGSGRSPRVVGYAIDNTSLRLEHDLLANRARLESISRLAGGIAHDFNNLLAGVLGGASFLEEVLPETHLGYPILGVIRRSSERAAHLTKQLLAYSGKSLSTRRKMDLNEAVQEGCTLAKVSLPPQVEIIWRPPSFPLPAIEADFSQVRDAALNLVTNAADALGTDGGKVEVSTGLVVLDEKQAESFRLETLGASNALEEGHYVYLEVRDEGEGMTPDVLRQMYEPFFTTRFTGRGLGLSAVHGIVRAHNGGIEVKSRPHLGTTFRLYFPAPESNAVNPGESSMEKSESGMVLVIDDEEAVRKIVHAALGRAGYRVLTASDGSSGLEIFRRRSNEISLVILDVSMPGLSSSKVLEELQRTRPGITVLITSGYSGGEALAQFPEGSTAGFVQKPFTVRDLAFAVQKVTRRP